LAFSEKGVDEVVKSVILRLWNSYSFFATYAALDGFNPTGNLDSSNILDKWLLSVTNRLIDEVTKALEGYDIAKGAKLLWEYIDQLSNWYIRRSRKRFWKSENDTDKNAAYETLYFALDAYNKLLAPFMPFVTDEIYQGLNGTKESVHLDEWPVADPKAISDELEEQMAKTRQVIELGLSKRNEEGIKVRQPLNELTVSVDLPDDLLYIAAEEVNVKEVTVKEKKGMLSVELDTKITQELKNEGIARDFVRSLQEGRKKAGFNVEDRIVTAWETTDMEVAAAIKSQSDYVAKETLSVEFTEGKKEAEYEDTVKLNGGEVWFGISRREK
jgi:isoleucyl-tRNA synthetase